MRLKLTRGSIKTLWRSRSLRFVEDRDPSRYEPGRINVLRWHGREIFYRPGTSDLEVIYKILLKPGRKAEYFVSDDINPAVVWDIGANIGAASLYFANRFPQAKIVCFEPVPDNFAILQRNITGIPGACAFNAGLGSSDGEMRISASSYSLNMGGFSFHASHATPSPEVSVMVRRPDTLARGEALPQPDLIKIDTEGAEWDILTAFSPEVLGKVRWIVGELHSVRSFELLEYLSPTFDIQTHKRWGNSLFNFSARNRGN